MKNSYENREALKQLALGNTMVIHDLKGKYQDVNAQLEEHLLEGFECILDEQLDPNDEVEGVVLMIRKERNKT